MLDSRLLDCFNAKIKIRKINDFKRKVNFKFRLISFVIHKKISSEDEIFSFLFTFLLIAEEFS